MAQIYQVTNEFEGVPAGVRHALLVADNGSFVLKRLEVAGQTLIEAVTKHGPGWPEDGLATYQEGLRLGFAEKIPWSLVQKTIAFFKAVYNRYQSEAIVLLWYAPAAPAGQRWQIMPPVQRVSGSRLQSDDPGPAPDGWLLAGSIHSHANMPAFHSGTDDADEAHKDGVHITVGNVGGPLPSFSVSVVADGTRFKLELEDVIEGVPTVDYPREWLTRVSKIQPIQVANSLGSSALQDWETQKQIVHPKGGRNGRS